MFFEEIDLLIEKDIRYKTKNNNLMNTEDKQKIEERIKKNYVRRKKTIRTFIQVGGICLIGIGVILLCVAWFFPTFFTTDSIVAAGKVAATMTATLTVYAWIERVNLSEEREKLTDKIIEIENEIDTNKKSVEKSGAFIARSEKFLENKDAMEYFLSQDLWSIKIWHKIDKLEKKYTKLKIELDFLGGKYVEDDASE